MVINPFCFNHPLHGAEHFLFRLLEGNYRHAGAVVRGRPDQLIDAALANKQEGFFSRGELEAALSKLQEGTDALLRINNDGMIEPTERFVTS